jgi:modulator of FtsH protease HflK
VIKATEDEKRYINQAEAYAKKRVLTAQGQVSRITQEADAYQYSVIAGASGSTARYLALLKPYQQAPGITRERLYLETMTDVLKNTNNILVNGGGNNVLYLPLEQLLQRQHTGQTAANAQAASAASLSNETPLAGESAADGNARPSYPIEGGGR